MKQPFYSLYSYKISSSIFDKGYLPPLDHVKKNYKYNWGSYGCHEFLEQMKCGFEKPLAYFFAKKVSFDFIFFESST